MDADLRRNHGTSVCDVIIDRLKQGLKLHIGFLDPNSTFVAQIAHSQHQQPEHLKADLAQSLQIVKDIYANLHSVAAEEYEI